MHVFILTGDNLFGVYCVVADLQLNLELWIYGPTHPTCNIFSRR